LLDATLCVLATINHQRGDATPFTKENAAMALPFYDRVTPRCGKCRRRSHIDNFWKWYEGRFCYRPICVRCEPSDRPVSPEHAELVKERGRIAERAAQLMPNVVRNPPAKATCPGCKRLLSLRKFHPKKVNCALCKECSPNAD
jgi:hypothetical protein